MMLKCGAYLSKIDVPFDCTSLPEESLLGPTPIPCQGHIANDLEYPTCPDQTQLSRPPEGGACTLSCPFEYYSTEQERALDLTSEIVSIFSLISSVFMCITWAIFPVKRLFPSIMVMYLSFCSFWISIGSLMNLAPVRDIHCVDEVTYGNYQLPACTFQGILLHFFPLSAAFWWLSLAINMHQMIVMENKQYDRLHKYYHMMSWGIPSILVIAALADRQYEYFPSGFKVCTLFDTVYLDWAYFSWFAIVGSIGVLITLHVIYALFQAHQRMRGAKSVGQKIFDAQLRTFMFMLFYTVIVMSILVICYYERQKKDEIYSSLYAYYECLATPQVPGEPLKKCEYEILVPYGTVYFSNLVVFGQGILLLLTFGLTQQNLDCWKGLLQGSKAFKTWNPWSKMGSSASSLSSSITTAGGPSTVNSTRDKRTSDIDLAYSSARFASAEAFASLGVDH
eukprot:TRINITY_DN4972_c0_g2_i3.p1 TRINITY_DN4972_c0_g2~~TRINITY_DN4972_c0_g2_i3.p1  ORF type:complete len:451 (-),score=66.70 TRINITY_DN4972_c0_g2_i3:91-1443(-)